MKGTTRFLGFVLAVTLGLAWAGIGLAEEKGPQFESAAYYGGSRHQGAGTAGQWEMGLSAHGSHLYISAIERALSLNDQTLGLKVTNPPGPAPVWTFRWFSDPTVQHHAPLPGIAATEEGVFLAGLGKSDVVSRYGVWGHKAVLVKYALEGPTGPNPGGAQWVVMPKFFPDFNGHEAFWDLIAVKEGGATFLYATGLAEAGENNVRAILAKFDSKGTLLWWRALGSDASYSMSWGLRVAAVNGQIYVAGSVNPDLRYDYWNWRAHIKPVLWKIDPAGNVMWEKRDTRSIADRMASAVGGSGNSVYLVATLRAGPDGNSDVLVTKFSEAGDLLWSKQWGTLQEDIVHAVAGSGDRLYVVGDTRGWVGGGDKDVFLLEMDAANGEVLSVQYHGGKYRDRAFRVLVEGRDLYVLGESYSHSNFTLIEIMLLRYTLSQEPPVLTVPIDIKPGSFPNPVNLKSKGNIPVAILSKPDFLAAQVVDRNSLTFGRLGDEKSLLAGKVQPEDVNGDGLLDLVCHFGTQAAGFQAGDTRGILKGKTLAGKPFLGMDSIVIVPHEKELKEAPVPVKPPAREETWKEMKPVPQPPKGETPKGFNPPASELKKMEKEGSVVY